MPTTAAATSTTTSPTTSTTSTTVPASTSTTEPARAGPAVAIRRGPTTEPIVALTFDAGSDCGHTAAVLDILTANGILATFGVTGRFAGANPDLVRRMAVEGHQIVNHSYDHPSFTGYSTGKAPLSATERTDQLERAARAIEAAAGTSPEPWFRPPYGDEDDSVRADIATAGYRYELLWTVDSLGWRGDAPATVVERCLRGAVPGAIYLFHVGSASTDIDALQPIIDGLRAQGYRFATARALLDV